MNISQRLLSFLQQHKGLPFRSMTVFNFLLEAALLGSLLILLVLLVRRFLREKLGSRIINMLWLLVAIRLLVPLALPNPMMNELRPTWSLDQEARPVADQIRVRTHDALLNWSYQLNDAERSTGVDQSEAYTASELVYDVAVASSYGWTGKWIFLAYLVVDGCVLLYMSFQNIRFQRKLKGNRVAPLEGEQLELYRALCAQRKMKPIPVWYVDPLPSACLVGVFKPYIALPLNLSEEELPQVLTHEICHQKVGDPWWAALRNLCCVVHWFNPLVWIAARCARTDCELACDERVTARMNAQERVAYAGTLVLAAARQNAPGISVLATGMTMTGKRLKQRVKSIVQSKKKLLWLVVVVAVSLVLVTAMAFFTAEKPEDTYEVRMQKALRQFSMNGKMEVRVPEGVQLKARVIGTEEEALAYATELLNTPYLQGMDRNKRQYTDLRISSFESQWRATAAGAPNGFELYFDTEGRLLFWDECYPLASESYSYEYELVQEPVEAYVRQFARDCLGNPDISQVRIDEQRYTTEERFIIGRAMDENGNGLFSFEIEPFSMRMISYLDLKNTTFGDGSFFSHAVSGLRDRLFAITSITPAVMAQGNYTVDSLDENTLCTTFSIPAELLSGEFLEEMQARYGTEVVYHYEYITDRYGVASPYCSKEAYLRRNEAVIDEASARAAALAAASAIYGADAAHIQCNPVDSYPEFGWYDAYCSYEMDGVELLIVVRVDMHDGSIIDVEPVITGDDIHIPADYTESLPTAYVPMVTLQPTLLPTNTPVPMMLEADTTQTLFFVMDGEEYALDIEYLKSASPSEGNPSMDDIAMKDAALIAVKAVCEEYGISYRELPNYVLHGSFLVDTGVEDTPKWWFNLIIRSTMECRYTIGVKSPDGEIVDLHGPGDGNG